MKGRKSVKVCERQRLFVLVRLRERERDCVSSIGASLAEKGIGKQRLILARETCVCVCLRERESVGEQTIVGEKEIACV